MLAGIMLDTRRFSIRATERTFIQASHLCGWGAKIEHVRLYFEDRIETFIARSQVVHDAIIEDGIAFSVLAVDIDGPRVVAAQAADELVFLRGIRISVVACSDGDDVAVSVRAREGISVINWVSAFGGGGTHTSAGFQLKGITPWHAIERVRAVINKKHSQ
jgi:c-di-AMP phosphodiesterase-like protein